MARQPPIATQPASRPAGRGPGPRLDAASLAAAKRAARSLGSHSPDTEWHAVRIRAKRCGYTAEAVAPVCGRPARRFAASMAAAQDLLGEHQDTGVAEAWVRGAGATASAACVAAGELIAAERLERASLCSRWPAAWKRASA